MKNKNLIIIGSVVLIGGVAAYYVIYQMKHTLNAQKDYKIGINGTTLYSINGIATATLKNGVGLDSTGKKVDMFVTKDGIFFADANGNRLETDGRNYQTIDGKLHYIDPKGTVYDPNDSGENDNPNA